MNRLPAFLAALAAALVAMAAPAGAAAGLFLTWGDCALGGAGFASRSIPCTSETGNNRLYLAFSLDQAVDQVLGMEVVVDLQTSVAPLEDWWHLEIAGPGISAGCRAGSLTASRDFSLDGTCVNPWAGTTGDALIADYRPGEPRAGSNQARIRATASLISAPGIALDATPMYYAIKLLIANTLTTTTCTAGCSTPACLVLNSIWLIRDPGAAGGNVLLADPGLTNQNWARWQNDTVQDCLAVPVRRATWGEIKSLYR